MPISLKSKILPAGLALLLLILSVPQTVDSVLWLMTGDIADQLGKESPAAPDQAASNAALLEKADAWTGDPKARIRAGVLRLRLATISNAHIDKNQLQRAIDDLTSGLARSPTNAYGWTALADAYRAEGELIKAKKAYTSSLLLDDYDPELSLWRCELGLQLWSQMDTDDRRMWNNQVRLAWDSYKGRGLLDIAHRDAGAALLIRLALITEPTQLKDFDRNFSDEVKRFGR